MKQILSLMTVLALAVMLLPGARANGVETGFDDIAGRPVRQRWRRYMRLALWRGSPPTPLTRRRR